MGQLKYYFFLTKYGFKKIVRIPINCKQLFIFAVVSFSSSNEVLHVYLFQYSHFPGPMEKCYVVFTSGKWMLYFKRHLFLSHGIPHVVLCHDKTPTP